MSLDNFLRPMLIKKGADLCLDEPQNALRSLAEGLEPPPPHLDPQIPSNPCRKSPQTTA